MDVNGTRFHLLVSRDDWARSTPAATGPDAHVTWDEERGGVGLRPLLYRFPRGDGLGLDRRRGNGRDGFGHVYAIDEDETGIEMVTADGRRQPWWPPPSEPRCPDPGDGFGGPGEERDEPLLLRGLAVTEHHYLVVGVPEPARLLVFDLHAGGPPMVLPWPGPRPFRPWDMAPREDGGFWLLEAEPFDPAVPARYWGLDRFFRLERGTPSGPPVFSPTTFRPEPRPGGGAGVECVPRAPVTAGGAWPVEGRAVALEALSDGSVLVLRVEADGSTGVLRLREGRVLGEADLRTPLLARFAPSDEGEEATWTGHDFAFVAEPPRRRGELRGALYVVGQDGNQAFAFSLVADEDGLTAAPREAYYPLRLFGGRGLLADDDTVLHDLAAPDGRWLPVVAQPRPRYQVEGQVVLPLLDGGEPGCVWHRFIVDGCLPSGTSLQVESRAADDGDRLSVAPWDEEPRPYLRGRGPELPHYRAFTPEEEAREGVGTWEILFQRARGRYLQLRLTLVGTGRSTPRLHAVRIHYPRFSYLREYLPDVYQEDPDSAHFLDRYLANPEGLLTGIEERIAGAEALFDERLLDREYLDWLAGWLGTVLDPAFDETRRRLFLRHAVTLYRERGTLPGLVRALRLALDPCPSDALFEPGALGCDLGGTGCDHPGAARSGVRVIERFLKRRVPAPAVGDPTEGTAPGLVAGGDVWTPEQGASRLHELFRGFLRRRHGTEAGLEAVWGSVGGAPAFPPLVPEDPVRAADWRAFVERSVAVPYAEVGPGDVELYRAFLERRHVRAERLSERYGASWERFADVPLPHAFPSSEPRLTDWMDFASLIVPVDRAGARFDVLVPVEAGTEEAEQADRLAFVERLVEREKPAHTEFEVKPFWDLFRVGDARVGLDTVLDRGSRYLPLLLPGAVGAVTAGRSHPWDVADRFVTGRDGPADSPTTLFETAP